MKAFTQYSSLRSYINACADIITERIPKDTRWLPQCYIKLDIAHFMTLASQWLPLKLLPRKVREIILRTIGRLIKCTELEDVYKLFLSLFMSITNESNGIEQSTGTETSCEVHSRKLVYVTSTGIIELDQQLDDIINYTGTEDSTPSLLEDSISNNQYAVLEEISNFKKLAEKIFEESKSMYKKGQVLILFIFPN